MSDRERCQGKEGGRENGEREEEGFHRHQAPGTGLRASALPGARSRSLKPIFHSVINGSNVQSDSVTNTTSNATRMPIHMIASGSSTGVALSAAVPRTPAMITGMVIGY